MVGPSNEWQSNVLIETSLLISGNQSVSRNDSRGGREEEGVGIGNKTNRHEGRDES